MNTQSFDNDGRTHTIEPDFSMRFSYGYRLAGGAEGVGEHFPDNLIYDKSVYEGKWPGITWLRYHP
jgi:hypothetical protein